MYSAKMSTITVMKTTYIQALKIQLVPFPVVVEKCNNIKHGGGSMTATICPKATILTMACGAFDSIMAEGRIVA